MSDTEVEATVRESDLADFYAPATATEPSLFQIWENGGARGDSVTPSTYWPAYRTWMRDKLIAELRHAANGRLLSLGSGNAAVESEVARAGFPVLAVDAMTEAVDLARAKGLEAVRADVNDFKPDGAWEVVYADGLLGHLYDPDEGLLAFLSRVRGWLAERPAGGTFVISNDSPPGDADAQPAPGVPGFYWLSARYLRAQALAAGFDTATTEVYAYVRPVSGPRRRAVVTATVGS